MHRQSKVNSTNTQAKEIISSSVKIQLQAIGNSDMMFSEVHWGEPVVMTGDQYFFRNESQQQ